MRIRVQRTEHGIRLVNEGDRPLTVSPAEIPDEVRDQWHRLEPACSYEVIIGGDLVVQTART